MRFEGATVTGWNEAVRVYKTLRGFCAHFIGRQWPSRSIPASITQQRQNCGAGSAISAQQSPVLQSDKGALRQACGGRLLAQRPWRLVQRLVRQ